MLSSAMSLIKELDAMTTDVWITNLSNASALLFQRLEKINWVGFYLTKKNELYLGPFQGKPACLYIPFGKGVCGTAAEQKKTLVVPDVHQFPGHIACDEASRSEIVVPLVVDGKVSGVLDVDSPLIDRFSQGDKKLLEDAVEVLVKKTIWPKEFF